MKTLLHLCKVFEYSSQGVRNTIYDEIAFRIELAVAVILIPAALLLPVSLIVSSVIVVLIIEMLNTAFEATVNKIPRTTDAFCQSKEFREHSGFNGIHKSRSCMGDSLV